MEIQTVYKLTGILRLLLTVRGQSLLDSTAKDDTNRLLSAYLKPFLSEVSLVSNFTVDSQIQHYAQLAVAPQYMEREKLPSYHYLTPETLPHFINSAEWNLGNVLISTASRSS